MKVFRSERLTFFLILAGLLGGELLFAADLVFGKVRVSVVTPADILYFTKTKSVAIQNSNEAMAAALPLTFIANVSDAVKPVPDKAQPTLTHNFSKTKSTATLSSGVAQPVGLPLFLMISKIKLRAAVQAVGFATSSAVGIPTNYTDVGWFKFGPRPGQIGNAIMDGHVVTHSFGAGVFSKLHTLIPGDEVIVATAQANLVFKVTKTIIYDVDQAPVEEIFGPTDKRRLNLITCDGVWVQERKMYDQRLVVFTELVRTVKN